MEIKADPLFLDSRGLAYALLGDYPAAIADFQAAVEWARRQPDEQWRVFQEQRESWIEDLKAKQNPFTPELLRDLRNEQ